MNKRFVELKNGGGKRFEVIAMGKNYAAVRDEKGNQKSVKNSEINKIFEALKMPQPKNYFQYIKQRFRAFLLRKLLKNQ